MKNLVWTLLAAIALAGCLNSARAEQETKPDNSQTSFATPDAAFTALIEGWEKNSDEKLLDVLGHAHKDLIVQTDKELGLEFRTKLSKLAKEGLKIEVQGEKAVACLGVKCWPYPIPIVKSEGAWKFDTAAGKEEILNRRIGHNELHAMKFLDAYDEVQREYASVDRTGDKVLKYAQKFVSTSGKKDGLYWVVPEGATEADSPLETIFEGENQDFLKGNGTDIPFNGYYFKILTKQGANAPNGKYDYVINGNMIAGFAIVAWPADYGSSGIMTFVQSHQGIIYQKDLGAETAAMAKQMDEYNPDNTWKEVKPEDR